MQRRSHSIDIVINGRRITEVVIDPHYEKKHKGSVNDELILELAALLDGQSFYPEDEESGFEYFRYEGLILREKRYRLIWVLERDRMYIGILNAFRRK